MKNIKMFKKAISVVLIALMLASSLLFAGCSNAGHDDETEDPHAGHDHSTEDSDSSNLSVLVPFSSLSFAENYPNVSLYDASEVKKEKETSGGVILRVARKDGDYTYCTAGNSSTVNYVVIGLPAEAEIDDYFVCNTDVYAITSERFGFSAEPVFSKLYVIYGSEIETINEITRENAANIFASLPS